MSRRPQAFSLIETIYSTVLLGFIALFLLNLYPSSFVAIKRGESTFTADNFASAIIEDLHSRNFANLVQGPGPPYNTTTWGGITYSATVNIIYPPGTNPNNVKEAQVTISWKYNFNRQVVHTAYLNNVTQ